MNSYPTGKWLKTYVDMKLLALVQLETDIYLQKSLIQIGTHLESISLHYYTGYCYLDYF